MCSESSQQSAMGARARARDFRTAEGGCATRVFMSVTRTGKQKLGGHAKSHVSGKHSKRFAARLKPNLDKQCERLERELVKKIPASAGTSTQHS